MVSMLFAAALTITSAAFTDGGNIPSKFTCDAGQTSPSPALIWKDAPAGTKSFALVMDDPDVTQIPGGFVHWVLYAPDVETLGLPQGASRADVEKALAEHKPLAMAETIGIYQKQAK